MIIDPLKSKEEATQELVKAMKRIIDCLAVCVKTAVQRPDGGFPVLERDIFRTFSNLFPELGPDEYLKGLNTLILCEAHHSPASLNKLMDMKALESAPYEFVTFKSAGFRRCA